MEDIAIIKDEFIQKNTSFSELILHVKTAFTQKKIGCRSKPLTCILEGNLFG
tara:strand:+ start:390 stop:545 length:156 start_codon:yes stop_codon:yes gene_type:complete